jgi:hypothetical protein
MTTPVVHSPVLDGKRGIRDNHSKAAALYSRDGPRTRQHDHLYQNLSCCSMWLAYMYDIALNRKLVWASLASSSLPTAPRMTALDERRSTSVVGWSRWCNISSTTVLHPILIHVHLASCMHVRHAAILEKAARDGQDTSHKVSLLHAGAREEVNTVQFH